MTSLFHLIREGGIIMIPLLLLSLGAIAVIFERLMTFRELAGAAPDLLCKVVDLARRGRFSEALELCDRAHGALPAVLATILRHRDRPVAVAERQAEAVGQEFFLRLERRLPFLDTVTTIAPLLGLLGTIVGMIGTFNAIGGGVSGANASGGGNSDAVLSGVGEALYATATGISIAIVCFVAYNAFAARLQAVTAETEQGATRLINALIDARAGHFPPFEAVSNPVSNPDFAESISAEEAEAAVQTPPRA